MPAANVHGRALSGGPHVPRHTQTAVHEKMREAQQSATRKRIIFVRENLDSMHSLFTVCTDIQQTPCMRGVPHFLHQGKLMPVFMIFLKFPSHLGTSVVCREGGTGLDGEDRQEGTGIHTQGVAL